MMCGIQKCDLKHFLTLPLDMGLIVLLSDCHAGQTLLWSLLDYSHFWVEHRQIKS